MAAPTSQPLLALVGPTASGKTEAALAVAEALGAEIVNADSANVYRGMDVQTAKPTAEQRVRVPHHLLDVAEPEEAFSVARYQRLALAAVDGIVARGRRAMLVGGSGLYVRAVVDRLEFPGTDPGLRALLDAEARVLGPEVMHRRLASLDPAAAAKIERGNARRTVRALEVAALTGRTFSSFAAAWERYDEANVRAAGVEMPPTLLYGRIERRAAADLPGLLEETERLLRRGAGPFLTAIQAIGYAEAMQVLAGELSRTEALERIVRRVKALARRQRSWFRRDPRVRWFTVGEGGAVEAVDAIVAHLAPQPEPVEV